MLPIKRTNSEWKALKKWIARVTGCKWVDALCLALNEDEDEIKLITSAGAGFKEDGCPQNACDGDCRLCGLATTNSQWFKKPLRFRI